MLLLRTDVAEKLLHKTFQISVTYVLLKSKIYEDYFVSETKMREIMRSRHSGAQLKGLITP